MNAAPLGFKDIESAVCAYFQIGPAQLRSVTRNQIFARRRYIAVRLARELTPLSLPALGDKLHRDHTTILNCERRAAELESTDAEFFDQLAAVRKILDQQQPHKKRLARAQLAFGGLTKPKSVSASDAETWV